MKKILFGITGLTLGGAERVLVDTVNQLAKKYEITIFTIYAKGELEKEIEPSIKIKSLYANSYEELSKFQKKISVPLKVLLTKKKIYSKYIKEDYDVEIAFLEGPVTRLISSKNKNVSKIAWIHNDISSVFGNGIKSKIKRKIDERCYSRYEKLIFVSRQNLETFEKTYPKLENGKQVIYNYLDKDKIIKKSQELPEIVFNKEKINFITVARLVSQKGIDRLIKVHSKLIKDNFYHNMYIIGDGPEKEKLQKQIEEEKVEKTFKLLGKKENPYPYINQADYFCLLSRFEGYGMVLEEAKILNKPIIITDTAAREAIENYHKGIIVGNSEEEIYLKLKKIIEDNKKLKLKESAEIIKTDRNKKIIEQIEKLLGE